MTNTTKNMKQLPLFTLDGYVNKVIRNKFPYVKLLSNPTYQNNRWEAIAQVEESLAVIEVKIHEYNWSVR